MKKLRKSTPPFRTFTGEIIPASIDEAKYQLLGGINQYVMIRGEKSDNPLLIILPGGPRLSDTPFFRKLNAALEKSYTMVYWDQRGVGKSYDPVIRQSSMTIEQFITDLNELIGLVCSRFKKNKVTILGHSWGSALGVLYSVRFPQKVAAYVGCGQ
jgi:pimeloyl-ACP methyl ester carboxylesterase